MAKRLAWVFAGAVLATTGVAHAQETAATAREGADLPWFQRFTASTGLTEALGAAEAPAAQAWTPTQRWGVTVDMGAAERVDRGVQGLRPDQTAVGAYYQFTPRVRVGGQVSLSQADRQTAVAPRREDEDAAGVRIESAFRF